MRWPGRRRSWRTTRDGSKVVAILVTSEDTALAFLSGYVRFLVGRGWRVIVGANSPTGQLVEMANSVGAEALHVAWEREPAPLSDAQALWHLTGQLRTMRPDLVVTATPKAGLIGTLAAFMAGVRPRVYQLWGLRLETSTGAVRVILGILEWLSIRISTVCVANSQSLARRAEELRLAPKGSIKVLGRGSSHGVNVDYFSPDAEVTLDPETHAFLSGHAADLTVVFVGRLHPDKGIDTLLRALAVCAGQGTAVRTIIVGPDEGFDPNRYIAGLPQDRIHLTGNVSDVRPYVLACDVLCLPSLREGFPNVVLEAAALGKPAVVSDATGVVDSVIDGETGRLFPTGDAHALAARFIELAADPSSVSHMGAAARSWATHNFPHEHIWDLQATLLDDLLARERT